MNKPDFILRTANGVEIGRFHNIHSIRVEGETIALRILESETDELAIAGSVVLQPGMSIVREDCLGKTAGAFARRRARRKT